MEKHSRDDPSHLHGVVQNIDEDSISVKMLPSSGSLEVDIPLTLCPDDVQYEGTAVEVVVSAANGTSVLSVNKRVPGELPDEINDTMNSVLRWAESL